MEDLSKRSPDRGSNAREPIGTRFKIELMSFMRMITERCDHNNPKARDISSYNGDDIIEYYLNYNRHLQNNASTQSQASSTQAVSNMYVKSVTEKALDNWNRGKRDKTAFPVLKDNNHYLTWNEEFTAKIRVQKMTKLIDKEYRRSSHRPE